MVFWPDIKFSLIHLSSWKRNIFCSEPTLRHSGLNCCCWHQELLWALVHVPTVPLMIQFLANMPGKAEEDSPSPWAPGHTWETGIQFSSAWFCEAQPQPVWECEESADRRFSLPFCDPTFQINTFFFNDSLSDGCGYFPLIPHYNLTGSCFFQFSCSVDFK